MKKIISLSLMLLLCLTLVTGCGKDNKKDIEKRKNNIKSEVNDNGTLKENKEILKEQIIDGITISNVELKTTTYSTVLSIKATNNTNSDIAFQYFEVYFKDKDGRNMLGDNSFALITVFDTIKPKESRVFNLNVDKNLSNVYNIIYKMIK